MKHKIVAPYLPLPAEIEVREWQARGKPVFVKAIQQSEDSCPNCGGLGAVYVVYCDKGPFRAPVGMSLITWYDGDMYNGRGWYTIARTGCYVCPKCGGKVATVQDHYVPNPETPKKIEGIAERMRT